MLDGKFVRNKRTEDLTGKIFGKLTVLEFAGYKKHYAYWRCICECNNIKIIRSDSLKSGHTKSCGNCYFIKVGNKIGKLVVLKFAGYKLYKDGTKRPRHTCKCECGNIKDILTDKLKQKNIKSCGDCNPIKVGDKFGKLIVLDFAGYKLQKNGDKASQHLCKCTCGNILIISSNHLKTKHTASCGCSLGGYSKKYNFSYDSS